MLKMLRTFCDDEQGTFLTTEWVFVATILVLGAFSYCAIQHAILRGEPTAQHLTLE